MSELVRLVYDGQRGETSLGVEQIERARSAAGSPQECILQ